MFELIRPKEHQSCKPPNYKERPGLDNTPWWCRRSWRAGWPDRKWRESGDNQAHVSGSKQYHYHVASGKTQSTKTASHKGRMWKFCSTKTARKPHKQGKAKALSARRYSSQFGELAGRVAVVVMRAGREDGWSDRYLLFQSDQSARTVWGSPGQARKTLLLPTRLQ